MDEILTIRQGFEHLPSWRQNSFALILFLCICLFPSWLIAPTADAICPLRLGFSSEFGVIPISLLSTLRLSILLEATFLSILATFQRKKPAFPRALYSFYLNETDLIQAFGDHRSTVQSPEADIVQVNTWSWAELTVNNPWSAETLVGLKLVSHPSLKFREI